jgi:hypothetical protein
MTRDRDTEEHPRRGLLALLAALAAAGCGGEETTATTAPLRERFAAHAEQVLGAAESFVATERGFASQRAEAAVAGRGLDVELPAVGDGVARFHARGRDVRVRELGATGAPAIVEHAVAYARAGGTSYWTVTAGGVEEWLHLGPGVARAGEVAAAWEVEGAALRQAGDVVEALDEAGLPLLRVTAPVAYAAGGREVPVRVDVHGARIELTVDAQGEEVLVDPAWVSAATMAVPRANHTATLLANGKVLVAGGVGTTDVVASAELYDPASNTWSPAPAMAAGRAGHTATRLGNGKVLVVGGLGGLVNWHFLSSAELYDPASNTWSAAASMAATRRLHTATTLGNGRILVTGGEGAGYLSSAELYDPAVDAWSKAASMAAVRWEHSATLLGNGSVLVAGGGGVSGALSSAELYDAAANTWSAAPSMAGLHQYHTATLLGSGRVLVAGGYMNAGSTVGAEIYDPQANGWLAAAPMHTIREAHTATLLGNGAVLVAGGYDNIGASASAEIYDPATDTWSTTPPLAGARYEHAATSLGSGQVLISGGWGGSASLAGAELFTLSSANGASCAAPGACASGFCVDGVCCNTTCGGGAPADCQACSVAAGAAQDGVCGPTTGNACDDGNACTLADTCQSGTCTGQSPVLCAASDPCHAAGTCNPATGTCGNPAKPDGTACNDGDACTLNDACLAGVCTGGGANPACQVCVTIARGLTGGVEDALIQSDKPTKNWGASNSLTAGSVGAATAVGLLRFDLGGIPATATITSATVNLHVLLHGGAPVRAHRVTAPWSEATVTWSSLAGAYAPAVEATLPGTSSPSASLTALVQAWVSGSVANDGILLEQDPGGVTVFASSEYQPGQRPSLDVCYVP